MELHSKYQVGLVCVMLVFPALCFSYDFTSSRATYYSTPDGYGTKTGACGYGDYGRTINNGMVAAVSGLWRKGAGCGACYQVKCKNAKYCDDYGAVVVATDNGAGDRTDFIMSPRAFSKLGKNSKASAELVKYGVVDIEYKRISCSYAGNNIKIKILDSSKYPDYLAIVLLYVPGQNDVTGVEIYKNDGKWVAMRRAYGAVFDITGAPHGQIKLRLQLSGKKDWVQVKSPIPGDWKKGASYDSQVDLN